MQSIRIPKDCGEYIMNCGTMRANQYAGKCANSAWLPMRACKKDVWVGLRQNIL